MKALALGAPAVDELHLQLYCTGDNRYVAINYSHPTPTPLYPIPQTPNPIPQPVLCLAVPRLPSRGDKGRSGIIIKIIKGNEDKAESITSD